VARAPHLQRGADGEEAAAAWYRARGYRVLARNWRCREGELDLIVALGGSVVFCEVKARGSTRFGVPAEAVTRAKQRRIRGLAVLWLREAAPFTPSTVRFDVAAVLGDQVDVIEAAF
jgi:putative endonuclease